MTHFMTGPIKDFALGIYDGPHATPRESDEGPIFLGIKNVTADGRLNFSQIKHISEEDFPAWIRRVTPQQDDIVFSYEATLHLYAIIPEGFRGCLGRRMALVRPNKTKVDPHFLHYYFLSPRWRKVVESNIISGATVERIPIERFPEFEVTLPLLDIQKQIAKILSPYDDLIENNRRRIALLEQSARLLYEEWFVRFRFPGHEHVRITNGLPEEWEEKRFDDVLGNHIGGGWGQDEPLGSETTPAYVIRGTDIESVVSGDFEAVGLRYHKDSALKSRLLKTGDIIFEVSGGSAIQLIGRSLLISKKILDVYDGAVICASFCKRLTPVSTNLSPYLSYHIKHIRENGELNTFIKQSASALQNFNFAAFLEHHFVKIPNKLLLDQFGEHISLVESQMFTLAMQIYSLRHARDLLLPRLMNGEIAV
jgi:type I restriction enzyme S subunit